MEAWFAAEHHDAAALGVVRRRAEPPRRLAKLFSVHKQTLRVVVLNACYSQELADLLVADIDCVVGMTEAIDDEAAILFSELRRALRRCCRWRRLR